MRRAYAFQAEKPKQESKTAGNSITKRSRISPPRRKIYSFKEIRIPEDCGSIDLSKKSIETFTGLPNLKFLTRMNLDSNPLRSFEGSPKLPSLRWLSAKSSPISRNPYFKLMAVIVFGNNITTINNEKVPQKVYQQADAFRDSLYPQLLKGILIANIAPLRFIDTKSDAIVNPEPSLLTATKKIGYKAPAVQEFERTIVEKSREQFRIPSIASICDEIIQREDEPNTNYFPDKFMDNFLSQLHDLRVKYNAKYENTSSDDNYELEEESNNEITQSQESINDASPIKPPQSKIMNQANSMAKLLAQSELDSMEEEEEISNEVEEENNSQISNKKDEVKNDKQSDQPSTTSHHSSNQDDLENKTNQEEEEENNENLNNTNVNEEEESNHSVGPIDNQEEEEKNENLQSFEPHSNEEEEEEEKIEINNKEEENNSKSIGNDNEEEENLENNEEEESKDDNNIDFEQKEEEEEKIDDINNDEEEEKSDNENNQSVEKSDQDEDEADANNQEANLSEGSNKSGSDQDD
ncbi:hypothetical protein M9Y10_038578 [Tritrichomonas musculus]|uniref:Leucine Rich Repeat family protein n=1 Tax=Tritrichomonas musculus TaxID=1915356 RepID=A0ABR2K8Z8_9EUKA